MTDPARNDTPDASDTELPRPQEPAASPPVFNLHGSIVMLSLICVAVHLLRTQVLSPRLDTELLVATAFFPLRYTPDMFVLDLPTLFSPVTYAFLHADWVHLGVNLVWLGVFGSPLACRIGWWRSLVFWVVTAALAAATHLAVYYGDPVPVIGASGAVSGFMGAAARFGLRANRRVPRRGFDGPLLSIVQSLRARGVLPFLGIWIVMNVVVGLNLFSAMGEDGVAWEAHIGGLVAGFLLVPLFVRRQ